MEGRQDERSAVKERLDRVDALLDRLESLPDQRARAVATDAVQAIMELYGDGLSRAVDLLAAVDGDHVRRLTEDPLLENLLVVHDLHPLDVPDRVERALEDVRPYLNSHGGDVSLLEIAGGVARIRLQGSCRGCPSSAATLQSAVEEAVYAWAPEVEQVDAEGTDAPDGAAHRAAFVPLDAVCPAPLGGPPDDGRPARPPTAVG